LRATRVWSKHSRGPFGRPHRRFSTLGPANFRCPRTRRTGSPSVRTPGSGIRRHTPSGPP
jgi:hypothetical protein